MLIRVPDDKLPTLQHALVFLGTAQAVALNADIIKQLAWREDPLWQAYIAAVGTNDELEVDDDTIVSTGGDGNGAWVMTWTWVSNEEAGIGETDDDPTLAMDTALNQGHSVGDR